MPLTAGSRLGPYEIVVLLGAGGMGEVYRARDSRLGREVAVKVLSADAAADPDRLARFEQEARAVAALSHPNVVAIFDVGAEDVPFLVTELLVGDTLRAQLERGPLGTRRTLELGLQISAGLAAAHARGIVHRDLKPENVLVTADGHVKILDFGLAKAAASPPGDDETLTRPHTLRGAVLGTPGYMAPEQVRGLEADARSDIFALGAILFELLTGRRAFRGGTPADTISAILREPPESLAFGEDAPPALMQAVRRCLDKDPARRFQTVRELAAALESISDDRMASAPLPGASGTSSIAVLPFGNLSADPGNEYFSDGLAEELINALARVSSLRVASRTSSFRFRGRDADIRQIGRELGVGAILEGSVRRSGTRLRVTVQLTDAAGGYHIWSERYDRELADVFDVQDEIVRSIVGALTPALRGEAGSPARRPTENLQAYDLYLRGRYYQNQRSPAVFAQAIRHFEEAIALDPGYALAYAGLADCYSLLRVYGWTPPEHSQPRALQAVSRALALDPDLPEAHLSHALYTFYFERNWRAARRGFETALAMNPRMALFEVYYGVFLATEYAWGAARQHIARALELDPHSSLIHFLAACAACAMVEPEAAERHARRALDLEPEALGPRWPLTVGLLMAGRHEEAIAAGDTVVARTRAPIYVGVGALVQGRAGRLDAARRLGRELDERQSRGEYIVPAARLAVQLGLGDLPGIRAALAGCVDGGAAPFSIIATTRWLLDGYRGDPEIDRLLDQLHDGARPGSDDVHGG